MERHPLLVGVAHRPLMAVAAHTHAMAVEREGLRQTPGARGGVTGRRQTRMGAELALIAGRCEDAVAVLAAAAQRQALWMRA